MHLSDTVIRLPSLIMASALLMWSCMRDVDGRPERPSSVTRVRPDLNLSTHSYTFCWLMVLCPYWANIRWWISTGFTPSAQRNRTTPRCSFIEQSCKGVSMFLPRCFRLTEGRALYCKWLNSSTGIVNTAQCASSSLSRLPHNLKIGFSFLIHPHM